MTTAEKERLLREKGLAFFGIITASVSHELNNAIAIIEQTAGLLEDITSEVEGDRAAGLGELQQIADRIGRQAVRGAKIVKRLNAFAHSVDDPERDLDVHDLVENVIGLSQRLADLKRIELVVNAPGSRVTVRSNPFYVQQALFLSIQQAMSLTEDREKITITIAERDSSAWIGVRCLPMDSQPSPDLTYLELLMGHLGGAISTNSDTEHVSLELTIPLVPPGC